MQHRTRVLLPVCISYCIVNISLSLTLFLPLWNTIGFDSCLILWNDWFLISNEESESIC